MGSSASSNAVSPYPIRPVSADEFDIFEAVDQHAFHGSPLPDAVRRLITSRFEFERSLAAFDGGQPVGTAGAYSFQLSVPGGETLPAAGVTFVSVLPTHRRRGVLTSIMRRQLLDIRELGEPLAVLWASEAAIYSRFGYGLASWQLSFTVRRTSAAAPVCCGRARTASPCCAMWPRSRVAIAGRGPGRSRRTRSSLV